MEWFWSLECDPEVIEKQVEARSEKQTIFFNLLGIMLEVF